MTYMGKQFLLYILSFINVLSQIPNELQQVTYSVLIGISFFIKFIHFFHHKFINLKKNYTKMW